MPSANDGLRFGIIGASSQVGAALAFHLRHFTNHVPKCFVRSDFSRNALRVFDIDCETLGNQRSPSKQQLLGLDVVLDFRYPAGQPSAIANDIKVNLSDVIHAVPKKCIFINVSSIMATGMGGGDRFVKHFFFPRTTYGYFKRQSERLTRSFGRYHDIKVFNFRLGQVHGFNQSVNAVFRQAFETETVVRVNAVASNLANVIFINNLSDSIESCVIGRVEPNLYTLVTCPQWTLHDLFCYYQKRYNFKTPVEFNAVNGLTDGNIKNRVFSVLRPFRPWLEQSILLRFPSLAIKLKGMYRTTELVKQFSDYSTESIVGTQIQGEPPTKLIQQGSSSVEDILKVELAMEELYMDFISRARLLR